MNIDIHPPRTPEEIEEVRRLFMEYERFLNVDLCFQDFEEELSTLPGKYAHPHGALLIATDNSRAIGCVALRKIEDGICEMKRLYVIPAYRGQGLGRNLAQRIIEQASGLGYTTMRLDTLDRLREAMSLYGSLGFKRTDAYYHNPLADVVYWELDLRK